MTFAFDVVPRYAEVDQQGVVFNSHYLIWFDEAFTAFLDHRPTEDHDAGELFDSLEVGEVDKFGEACPSRQREVGDIRDVGLRQNSSR